MKFLYIIAMLCLLASCSAKWPAPGDGYTDIDYDCTGLESKCHVNNFMWCNNGTYVVINCESKGKLCYEGIGCVDEIPDVNIPDEQVNDENDYDEDFLIFQDEDIEMTDNF